LALGLRDDISGVPRKWVVVLVTFTYQRTAPIHEETAWFRQDQLRYHREVFRWADSGGNHRSRGGQAIPGLRRMSHD
jgi:hypothetical protein